MLYLGLDEGRSGTRAVVLDRSGYVLSGVQGQPGNLVHHNPKEIVRRWSFVIEKALSTANIHRGQIARAGFGLSSLVWPSDYPRLEAIVAQIRLPCPTVLFDDCLMVLRAGLPDGVGIALLAGSGSGVIGRNARGSIFQTFGSSQLGDGGGGWALTGRVIEWIALSYLSISPKTSLTDKFLDARGLQSIPALLEDFNRHPGQYQCPAIIQTIFRSYEQDDIAAQVLLKDLAGRYVDNIVAVMNKLDLEGEPFNLVLSGKLINAPRSPLGELVAKGIEETIPYVQTTRLKAWPAIGAAIAAMDSNEFTVSESVRLKALTYTG